MAAERTHQPGDGCRFLPGARVEHVDCTDYPAGTITDVLTGEILERPKP